MPSCGLFFSSFESRVAKMQLVGIAPAMSSGCRRLVVVGATHPGESLVERAQGSSMKLTMPRTRSIDHRIIKCVV